MKKIHVDASCPYDVLLENGILADAGTHIAPFCKNDYAAIITDDTVNALYSTVLEASLLKEGIRTVKFVFPHGEQSKSAETYIEILEFLAENHLTRSDLIIALGGGVVGDMAGFAAATYLRGISFVQIPTTLLAMVDSSVGGKTAIDLRAGKNLAGAFYQPKMVLCDPAVLNTLPQDIFRDGSAEVIKYGVLGSRDLFMHLKEKGENFDRTWVIAKCIEMKSEIVRADEFESGQRMLLNFGHTFGHAVEKMSNFSLSHGRAVSIGMMLMAKSALAASLCEEEVPDEIEAVLKAFSLPLETDYSAKDLYGIMLSDKKRSGDSLTVVIPSEIGKCTLLKKSTDSLLSFLESAVI
ncbi:MAG: 3-dehydroquinate synthase [Clostridia bacterium]|nr:3-dehydroquinate synthase [Clostridia bacterium]